MRALLLSSLSLLALGMSLLGCGSLGNLTGSTSGGGTSGSSGGSTGASTGGSSGAPTTTNGTATLSGSVQGHTFSPADAAAGISGMEVAVYISNHSGICADQTGQNVNEPNDERIQLTLNNLESGNDVALTTGTYTVGSGTTGLNVAVGQFGVRDATCAPSFETMVTAGTVTLSSLTTSMVAGTYSLNFGSDQVTGSFSASDCAAYDMLNNNSPSCR
jgi:hypothetical protein